MLENRLISTADAIRGRIPQSRLGKGDRGPEVKALQKALVAWMPSWKGKLATDGKFGPQTAAALDTFKRCYGLGKDGNSLDEATRHALATYRSQKRPLARPQLYEKARKRGFPFDFEQRIRERTQAHPRDMVEWQGFPLQAGTAARLLDFNDRIKRMGYHMHVTCTTGGTHSSAAHGEGRAVDLVVEGAGCRPITATESWLFEKPATDSKLSFYNEYVYDSLHKTGPHIHLEGPVEGP